ncbi:LysR family transcriptional regulator [Exiguobacterium oxidotolerans]|uniref:LysR family transcriptional regulator n=1 Tax=Exiguobacterium oxidotolerans TaxID=223958 RepID=UPI000494A400|nr:LysR family transcriptional regulator [Exiguobacterium oxidotolerans]
MKTEWLEAFQMTAETKSLTKASELLHLTQPALSKQIKSLEHYLGTTVFHRSATGVALTPAGEIVYAQALQILSQLSDMQRQIDQLQGQVTFTLGSWPSVAMSYLPQHLALHPSANGPELKIKTAHTYVELMAGLEQHHYDGVLLDDRQIDHPYPSTHLYTEQFLLYFHREDERFTGCDDVRFDQIEAASFLSLPTDCDSTNILKAAFQERGATYTAASEMEFGSSVLGFIRAKLGIAILPEIFQDGLPPEIRTLPITGFDVKRELSLVTRDATHHKTLLGLIGHN